MLFNRVNKVGWHNTTASCQHTPSWNILHLTTVHAILEKCYTKVNFHSRMYDQSSNDHNPMYNQIHTKEVQTFTKSSGIGYIYHERFKTKISYYWPSDLSQTTYTVSLSSWQVQGFIDIEQTVCTSQGFPISQPSRLVPCCLATPRFSLRTLHLLS